VRGALAAALLGLAGCYDFSVFSQHEPDGSGGGGGDLTGVRADLAAPATGWEALPSGTDKTLYAVWGTAADNVYAVGDQSTIVHYDGAKWTAEQGPPGTAVLEGVSGSGQHDLWIVGANGTALHGAGAGVWTPSVTGSASELYAVWVASDGTAYAVGQTGTVLRYQGAWLDDSAAVMANDSFTSVSGGGSGGNVLVYAVGNGGSLARAKHGLSPTWTTSKINSGGELDSVWSNGAEAFAGGPDGQILHTINGGVDWVAQGMPENPIAHSMRTPLGLWGSSGSDVWAVGDGGFILHYDGSAWSMERSNTMSDLRAVWGSGSEVFAVGTGGLILHRRL
jgi:hypothetical protein